jgi:phosphopantetheine--protein transferase-like protein
MLPVFSSIPSVLDHGSSRVFLRAVDRSKTNVWTDLERADPSDFFTEAEWQGIKAHPQPEVRYVLEWVGKQAACQAINWQGRGGVRLQDIEIWHDIAGAPFLRASLGASSGHDFSDIALSMSGEGELAIGAAVAFLQTPLAADRVSEEQILGIGIDLVAFEHLGSVPDQIWQIILQHTFTPGEIEESLEGADRAGQVKILSAMFAGKEAVFKSFGWLLHQAWLAGFHPGGAAIDFRGIEILEVHSNQPRVNLPGGLREVAQSWRAINFQIKYFFETDVVVALALGLGSGTA